MNKRPIPIFADARRHKYLTQRELAAKLGIAKNYLSQLERGNRKAGLNLAQRLAAELGLHLHDIRPDWRE